jgi:hypothetical protein
MLRRVRPAVTGTHVGQVLDVRASGHTKVEQVCWDPAPIDRPACSPSANGAPSATGTTTLTLNLADGSTLTKAINVTPAYTRQGGHGGSDAAPGHVSCAKVTLFGNPGGRDRITTLKSGDAVAMYNKIGRSALFLWHYADNKAGFAKARCATPGLG